MEKMGQYILGEAHLVLFHNFSLLLQISFNCATIFLHQFITHFFREGVGVYLMIDYKEE